jgi:hypothetical protein
VTIDAPEPVYDDTLTRDQIKQREREIKGNSGTDADIVLGTTESDIEPKANFQASAAPDGNGRFCAYVSALGIVIDWKTTVHVAAELKPGSCMYNVVLTHEQGHVEIGKQAMGLAKDLIRRAMAGVARRGFSGATPEQGYKALQSAATAALRSATTQLNTELKRRQKVHDSPEEYAKGRKVCGLVEYMHAIGR